MQVINLCIFALSIPEDHQIGLRFDAFTVDTANGIRSCCQARQCRVMTF